MTARDTPADHSAGRRRLVWLIKAGVSAGLLYILFQQIDAGRLWRLIRGASIPWIAAALGLYFLMVVISTWRWRLLLAAQHVRIGFGTLLNSYLVAVFANNFLPSNIGGDVVRIRDTARPIGSKTLATAIVLADRGVGILGLAFVATLGSSLAARRSEAIGPLGPSLLWTGLAVSLSACVLILAFPALFAKAASPLKMLHAEWVELRISLIQGALERFRARPGAMLAGFGGAILVQATLVAFYFAAAAAIHLTVPLGHLAILVPVSFIVQMMPLSVNGLGVREATFGFYLSKIGVPLESAIALSFIGAALVMVFSMTGAVAYLGRRRAHVQGY